jgi:50S ribosomal protein L16 3-hydroxylase
MLYLPPGYAHDGVALDECMTCSIGFRAPAWRELRAEFLAYLQERTPDGGLYGDPDLRPASQPGRIGADVLRRVSATLAGIRWNDADVLRFLGSYLTEPKPHVVFRAPQRPLAPAQFARRAAGEGVALDARSRMLYARSLVFINGECEAVPGAQRTPLRRLADRWMLRLSPGEEPALLERLHRWYRCGYLHTGTAGLTER